MAAASPSSAAGSTTTSAAAALLVHLLHRGRSDDATSRTETLTVADVVDVSGSGVISKPVVGRVSKLNGCPAARADAAETSASGARPRKQGYTSVCVFVFVCRRGLWFCVTDLTRVGTARGEAAELPHQERLACALGTNHDHHGVAASFSSSSTTTTSTSTSLRHRAMQPTEAATRILYHIPR